MVFAEDKPNQNIPPSPPRQKINNNNQQQQNNHSTSNSKFYDAEFIDYEENKNQIATPKAREVASSFSYIMISVLIISLIIGVL